MIHGHRFDDGMCACGRTYAEVAAERLARAARSQPSDAVVAANDRDRAIRNESRRDRRRFHGGR